MPAKKPAPMFYVVTKALAAAMRTGKQCQKGTVYGIFGDPVRAFEYRYERGLMLCSEVVEV